MLKQLLYLVVCRRFYTVVQNDFDMRNDDAKTTTEPAVYKSGCRGREKVNPTPSKLKVGALGVDAIVKPNK